MTNVEGRPPSQLNVEIAQHSDPGRDPNKQVNEDSCGYANTKFGHLCVLCDGMGGHYGGQEASRRAITTIFEQIEKAPAHLTPATALKLAIEEAARRVYELGGPPDNKIRPGSTVVSMLLHDGGVDVAHVGDSRAYVVRSNQIYPLTRDHSMVQSMIDAGFLTEEQAIGHPDANKITRALGMKPEVDVEVRPEPMELFPGDILFQSSDGLTDLALGHELLAAVRQALAAGNVEHCCRELVRMANDRGGHDNITVQMARVIKTAPKQTRVGMSSEALSAAAFGAPAAQASATGMSTIADGGPKFTPSDFAPPPGSQRVKQTIPMQPGMGAALSAAVNAATPPHAGAMGVGPTMGAQPPPPGQYAQPATPAPQQAPFGAYRMDGAGALAPPPSIRYGGAVGGAATPTPGPYHATPTPGWDANLPSAPPALDNRNVLFLWMGVAFMLATVILILIWALFWR